MLGWKTGNDIIYHPTLVDNFSVVKHGVEIFIYTISYLPTHKLHYVPFVTTKQGYKSSKIPFALLVSHDYTCFEALSGWTMLSTTPGGAKCNSCPSSSRFDGSRELVRAFEERITKRCRYGVHDDMFWNCTSILYCTSGVSLWPHVKASLYMVQFTEPADKISLKACDKYENLIVSYHLQYRIISTRKQQNREAVFFTSYMMVKILFIL